ncbi:hypothetical protein ACH41E_33555 [Streptomyces sp. NPDC020412]|uniref:aromatic-ring hydroxylase C-terminal domain-containing protein n=1 Tax=Streptomyces sp. NPDC020412 TaxID=3365073 RepID=UPI00378BB9A3
MEGPGVHRHRHSAFGGATALLVRPDGYAAWAGNDADGLSEALQRRFGAADATGSDPSDEQGNGPARRSPPGRTVSVRLPGPPSAATNPKGVLAIQEHCAFIGGDVFDEIPRASTPCSSSTSWTGSTRTAGQVNILTATS